MLRNYVALVVILGICLHFRVTEADEREPLYSQLTRAVVKLEQQKGTCDPDSQKAMVEHALVGSAFFVEDSFEGQSRYFIVTARHNVDHPIDQFIRVSIGPGSKESIVLRLPHSDWIFHPAPTQPGYIPIDVAVMQIVSVPIIKTFLNCPSGGKDGECGRNARTKNPLHNQIGKTPLVLSRVTFLGFPSGGLTPTHSLEPMARAGVVASTVDNPNLKVGGRPLHPGSVYLVDAVALRGHSGGPVLKEQAPFSGRLQLWGLVTATNDRVERYTIVTRPEMIAETIAHARQLSKVNTGWSAVLSPPPVECPTKQL